MRGRRKNLLRKGSFLLPRTPSSFSKPFCVTLLFLLTQNSKADKKFVCSIKNTLFFFEKGGGFRRREKLFSFNQEKSFSLFLRIFNFINYKDIKNGY